MSDRRRIGGASLDRRSVLRGLARAGAGLAGTMLASRTWAQEDPLLQALIRNQQGNFEHGFDAASRTIRMPKTSLPTLSPDTVATTERAIGQYEGIVAQGGWPKVSNLKGVGLGPWV